MTKTVTGKIHLDVNAFPCEGAVLRIKLEDVSRADALALEVAQKLIPNCQTHVDYEVIPFSLDIENIEETKRYEVRVHLDLNGSGEYSSGDQISMQSYPVLTQGHSDTVEVHLRQIR